MKKMKKIVLFSLLLGGVLMSKCQDDTYLEEEITTQEFQKKSKTKKEKPKKKIKYKGFTVNHRFNSSELELKEKHSKKYLKKLYNKLRKNKKAESKFVFSKVEISDLDLPSPEVIVEAVKVVINQFPYEKIEDFNLVSFNDENSLNLDMISGDFESFTEADIETNNEVLDEYYSQNLDYLVLEEIANHPQIYNNIGNTVMSKTSNETLTALCTILAMGANGYGFVRGTFAYYLAGTRAKDSSANYYIDFPESDSRRDAYRHILWNSLLAQYYFTISSKAPRLGFAKLVTDAREYGICANSNEVDSRQMDYHNNFIGRKIWDDNTAYRTLWGWNVGLRKPSTSRLKDLAHEKVEKQSCFIVGGRFLDDNIKVFHYSNEETKSKILVTYKNTAVYIKKPFAPKRYITTVTYDYSDCDGGYRWTW